jgi:hypothetical protein
MKACIFYARLKLGTWLMRVGYRVVGYKLGVGQYVAISDEQPLRERLGE